MSKRDRVWLDFETRSAVPLGDTHFGCDDQIMAYAALIDGALTVVRMSAPKRPEVNETITISPDAVLDDGTMIDYKLSDNVPSGEMIVIMGGDLLHHDYSALERRALAHMTADEFNTLRDKFNRRVESLTARRPRPPEPMVFREVLRDKPKRDWEQRNRKQRRR